MNLIKTYLSELISKGKREDEREALDYRKIKIDVNPIKRANGSARVKIGETEVLVGLKMDVGTPFPDTPASGILICNAELNPLASPEFEPGPPGNEAVELARVTDRAIRESGCVDFDKLCIKPEEKVWILYVDIYPINADGNLIDAAVLGAITSLKNARLPKYDAKADRVLYEELTKECVPVTKTPILCTFGKINGSIFLDPTQREEDAMDARLSIATVEDGTLCAMQKGGEGTFAEEEVLKIAELATEKGKGLRKLIK